MTTVFPLRRLRSRGLALLVALGAWHVGVAGDTGPSVSAAARVHRLAQNVERAESVRAVKRLQETYAQYSQFGLWTDMAALFTDDAQLLYGKDNQQGRQSIQNYFLTTFGEGTQGLRSLARRLDILHAGAMKRGRGGEDDEVHHEVREEHAGVDVEARVGQLMERRAAALGYGLLPPALLFLDFLGRLPEKQIR